MAQAFADYNSDVGCAVVYVPDVNAGSGWSMLYGPGDGTGWADVASAQAWADQWNATAAAAAAAPYQEIATLAAPGAMPAASRMVPGQKATGRGQDTDIIGAGGVRLFMTSDGNLVMNTGWGTGWLWQAGTGTGTPTVRTLVLRRDGVLALYEGEIAADPIPASAVLVWSQPAQTGTPRALVCGVTPGPEGIFPVVQQNPGWFLHVSLTDGQGTADPNGNVIPFDPTSPANVLWHAEEWTKGTYDFTGIIAAAGLAGLAFAALPALGAAAAGISGAGAAEGMAATLATQSAVLGTSAAGAATAEATAAAAAGALSPGVGGAEGLAGYAEPTTIDPAQTYTPPGVEAPPAEPPPATPADAYAPADVPADVTAPPAEPPAAPAAAPAPDAPPTSVPVTPAQVLTTATQAAGAAQVVTGAVAAVTGGGSAAPASSVPVVAPAAAVTRRWETFGEWLKRETGGVL